MVPRELLRKHNAAGPKTRRVALARENRGARPANRSGGAHSPEGSKSTYSIFLSSITAAPSESWIVFRMPGNVVTVSLPGVMVDQLL